MLYEKDLACVLLCLLMAGCAAQAEQPDPAAPVWIAQGYHQSESLASCAGEVFAFMPAGEGSGARMYLYAVDENGKKRIVCDRTDCAHEEQGTLAQPCHAYSVCTRGLMAEDGALYAASPNGEQGVMRFDPKGTEPQTVLKTEQRISCFWVQDGVIYYAQQDQDWGEAEPASPQSGYRLLARPLQDAQAQPEILYERQGAVGYIACIQPLDGWLYLTEIHRQGDRGAVTNIVRVRPQGGEAELFAQGMGGHFIVSSGDRLAAARQESDGSWTAVLMTEQGEELRALETGPAACMLAAGGDCILVDSGLQIPARERTLRAYDEEGTLVAECTLPAGYGRLLGADAQFAYYWEEGEKLRLKRVEWRQKPERPAA